MSGVDRIEKMVLVFVFVVKVVMEGYFFFFIWYFMGRGEFIELSV